MACGTDFREQLRSARCVSWQCQGGLILVDDFLPIGIGSLVGGWFSGRLLHHFGEVTHQPQRIWWVVVAVGVITAALLWIYDLTLAPAEARQIEAAPVK